MKLRTAEEWASVFSAAKHMGATGEYERQIRRIQANAFRAAIAIADKAMYCPQIRDELALVAKELDPHDIT